MKKSIILTVVLLLMISLGLNASAETFPDVPTYHWAYDAIKEVTALGLYIGYPDGEFKGDSPLSRYESALVVARMIAHIEEKIDADFGRSLENHVDAVERVVAGIIKEKGLASKEELEDRVEAALILLDALKREFAEELNSLGLKAEILEKGLDDMRARLVGAEIEIVSLKQVVEMARAANEARFSALIENDKALANRLLNIEEILLGEEALVERVERTEKMAESINALEMKNEGMDARLRAVEKEVSILKQVRVSGTSDVIFKDVDITRTLLPSDYPIYRDPWLHDHDEDEDIDEDDLYFEEITFGQLLSLVLEADVAEGVRVEAGLNTITNLFGDNNNKQSDIPDEYLNLEIEDLYMDIRTGGVLRHLRAGDITISKGKFSPFTLAEGELTNKPDNIIPLEGVLAEGIYSTLSYTAVLGRQAVPDGKYFYAAEVSLPLTESFSMDLNAVKEASDNASGDMAGLDRSSVTSIEAVYSLPNYRDNLTVSGEVASFNSNGVSVASAKSLDITKKIDNITFSGRYFDVGKGFIPAFSAITDEDDNIGELSFEILLPIRDSIFTAEIAKEGDSGFRKNESVLKRVEVSWKGDISTIPMNEVGFSGSFKNIYRVDIVDNPFIFEPELIEYTDYMNTLSIFGSTEIRSVGVDILANWYEVDGQGAVEAIIEAEKEHAYTDEITLLAGLKNHGYDGLSDSDGLKFNNITGRLKAEYKPTNDLTASGEVSFSKMAYYSAGENNLNQIMLNGSMKKRIDDRSSVRAALFLEQRDYQFSDPATEEVDGTKIKGEILYTYDIAENTRLSLIGNIYRFSGDSLIYSVKSAEAKVSVSF